VRKSIKNVAYFLLLIILLTCFQLAPVEAGTFVAQQQWPQGYIMGIKKCNQQVNRFHSLPDTKNSGFCPAIAALASACKKQQLLEMGFAARHLSSA
jgi:hypothetical protein